MTSWLDRSVLPRRVIVDAERPDADGLRLAVEALTLAREQVRIEEGKLRLGLTSAYHMGRVRSELVTAETREVSAKIDYLNALSELDRVEGAVLRRWNIVFEDAAAALPDLPGR